MHIFTCDHCDGVVSFTASECPACGTEIGYDTDRRRLRAMEPTSDPAVFQLGDDDRSVWRCLNAAWGCNWVVPTSSDNAWCRSCQLTRGRPDVGRPVAVEAWMSAEAAKRRLVHQLDELALPIDARSTSAPDGLAFDLVHLPGEGGITGHLDGVVTLDLAEADEQHRDDLRRRLGEPFRTVIGHLRHEIGHHYWNRLVGQSDELDRFDRLFGDPHADYATAVQRHYAEGAGAWDPTRFVTAYAASHPHEDWAETFAHYLHIIDTIDTAVAHDLIPHHGTPLPTDGDFQRLELSEILEIWRPINRAVTAIAEALGAPPVYPFEPTGIVVDKLDFVHRQIAAHTERDRFYASH